MTFIAEDGGRTVNGGTIYDKRKVYEVTYIAVLDEVQSVWGTGEVERTGNTVIKDMTYHVIADSEELARALCTKRWGSEFLRHTLKSIKLLFVIDGEISIGNN